MDLLIRCYVEIPPMTKLFCTLCVLVTLSVHLELVTHYDIYFNPRLVLYRGQVWRLLTCFLHLGKLDMHFVFNIIFAYRHSYSLETSAFLDRLPELILMWLFGCSAMLIMASITGTLFLNQSLTLMLIYVWSRRNPYVNIEFFGLVHFPAPYFPMMLVGFSYIFGGDWTVDFIGFWAGHMYYHLEYVFPKARCGFKVLYPPQFLKTLFGRHPVIMEVYDESTAVSARTHVPEINENPDIPDNRVPVQEIQEPMELDGLD